MAESREEIPELKISPSSDNGAGAISVPCHFLWHTSPGVTFSRANSSLSVKVNIEVLSDVTGGSTGAAGSVVTTQKRGAICVRRCANGSSEGSRVSTVSVTNALTSPRVKDIAALFECHAPPELSTRSGTIVRDKIPCRDRKFPRLQRFQPATVGAPKTDDKDITAKVGNPSLQEQPFEELAAESTNLPFAKDDSPSTHGDSSTNSGEEVGKNKEEEETNSTPEPTLALPSMLSFPNISLEVYTQKLKRFIVSPPGPRKPSVELLLAQNGGCANCGVRLGVCAPVGMRTLRSVFFLGSDKAGAPTENVTGQGAIHNAGDSMRYCEYFGLLFCGTCQNEKESRPLPGLICHSWDFRPRCVSRPAAVLLDALSSKPFIHLRDIHPAVKRSVPELVRVHKLRQALSELYKQVIGQYSMYAGVTSPCLTACDWSTSILDIWRHAYFGHWISDLDAFSVEDLDLIRQKHNSQGSFASTVGGLVQTLSERFPCSGPGDIALPRIAAASPTDLLLNNPLLDNRTSGTLEQLQFIERLAAGWLRHCKICRVCRNCKAGNDQNAMDRDVAEEKYSSPQIIPRTSDGEAEKHQPSVEAEAAAIV